nr:MAG: hypothetical protein [Bacteriophage sp.]
MTSEIYKLKHFHIENYSGTNFTDDLNDGEEFLYTTIRCKDDKGGFVGPLGLSRKLYKRYVEADKKLRKNQPLTASDKTHLYGYLNPYYRSTYHVPKRRK